MVTLLAWPFIVAGLFMIVTAIIALPGFFQPVVQGASRLEALVTRWLGPGLLAGGCLLVVLGVAILR
jgi:Na+/proline symporter